MNKQKHLQKIKEQFNLQASAYTSVKAHSDSLHLLIELSGVSSNDTVLEVACGSGIVACAFAKYALQVTGVDISSNMLLQAQKLQQKNNLNNIHWILDDILPLNFNDEQFSIVVTRFSFHHFLDYEKVFEEMIRTCTSGGTILVIDVVLPKEKVDAYNKMEKLRDPSHTSALTTEQFEKLFKNPQLHNCRHTSYQLEIELETQLNASFPEDRQTFRSMIVQDFGINNLGVDITLIDVKYFLHYPVSIYTVKKN